MDTVGRNKKQIQEYIKNQLTEDQIADQVELKEFVDPFTGSVNKKAYLTSSYRPCKNSARTQKNACRLRQAFLKNLCFSAFLPWCSENYYRTA